MKRRFRTGGLSVWSINRPIAVMMISLTVIAIGIFSFDRLNIDLLPDIIYPDIRVRVTNPGVPATLMEDNITRQLEEQLAISDGATSIQSETTEGTSKVNLKFSYDTNIDVALRDASTRLDRAKRFLPDTINPPIIYKRDPGNSAILELIASSSVRGQVDLRNWADYEFSKWFLNIKGVASVEIGGGLKREIQIIIDQEKLATTGFEFNDVINSLKKENIDISTGQLYLKSQKISTRINGRFKSIREISQLRLFNNSSLQSEKNILLEDVADIIDSHEDESLRIRLNSTPGIKLSIQKHPQSNTVDVVNNVLEKLKWFKQEKLLPDDIVVEKTEDQSTYIRSSLNNVGLTALFGIILAMLVVYMFLGNIRGTLIISTAIPLAIFCTLFFMDISGIALNIMSLGGLALGIGLLVDNTIVMLENISRHQHNNDNHKTSAIAGASEVTSAITAATITNLAAILPFLFVGGLLGLLFSELIMTLSYSIIASLLVAITIVPSLSSRINIKKGIRQSNFNVYFLKIQAQYEHSLRFVLNNLKNFLIIFITLFLISLYVMNVSKDSFFPQMDEGKISIIITTKPGTRLKDTDTAITKIEELILKQPEVESVSVSSGGFTYGRSVYERSNRGSMTIQLKPIKHRNISSIQWTNKIRKEVKKLKLVDYRINLRVKGIRGINLGKGEDDISIRVQGNDIETLSNIGDKIINAIKDIPGTINLEHNYQEKIEEIVFNVDRLRANDLGISTTDIQHAMDIALDGLVISNFLDNDRQYNIRLRANGNSMQSTTDLNYIYNIIVKINEGEIIRLRDLTKIKVISSPVSIKRDEQRRIVDITGSLLDKSNIVQVMNEIYERIDKIDIPDGYNVYDGGTLEDLRKDQSTIYYILPLALFLVFVVMSVHYESLSNPLIIMVGVPFTLIGIALAVSSILDFNLTMPAKFGIIMLAGIVVNNSIVLIEQIELQRENGENLIQAITNGATVRLRPIMMTTLTTVVGMLPIAIGFNEGSEILKPMAIIIISGLTISMIISLFLIPSLYYIFYKISSNNL